MEERTPEEGRLDATHRIVASTFREGTTVVGFVAVLNTAVGTFRVTVGAGLTRNPGQDAAVIARYGCTLPAAEARPFFPHLDHLDYDPDDRLEDDPRT